MNDQNANPNPAGTTLIPAKCTNCNGELTVDPSQECAICEYCGTPFLISKAIQNYNIQHNHYETNIHQRKGAIESILNYASERQDKKQQLLEEERRREEEEHQREEENKKKILKMILWGLGWIYIFPVPLTILILRNNTLNSKTKHKVIEIGWLGYLILLIASGIIGNHSNKVERSSSDHISSITAVVEETSDTITDTKSESTETLKTGFDEATNIEVKNGGLIYHIPDYYEKEDTSSENSVIYQHKEDDGSFAQVGFELLTDELLKDGLSEEEAKAIFQIWLKNINLGDDIEATSISQDSVLDRTEYEIGFKKESGNASIWGYMAIIENIEANGVNLLTNYIYQEDTSRIAEYDYLTDMDSIFFSIALDEDYTYNTPLESNDQSDDEIRKNVENKDYSLVTPEFKATMDSYESFYDEYIAFMNKYTSGEGDMTSMLDDYTKMLEKMNEWSQKIDAIDESTLSPADDAYFLLVTLRIEQKLLGNL